MPSVFTDATSGDRDLTITTSADWTIHTGDMPNGDSAASLSTSLNENARWSGDEALAIVPGSGTEAKTFEVWVNVTANTNDRWICSMRTNGTSDTTTNRHYHFYLTSTETFGFSWMNTSAFAYLTVTSATVAAGWHHVVVVVQSGSTRSMTMYIDTVNVASSSSPASTPTSASSDTYIFYMGTERNVTTREMTDHMAKLAIYNFALSGAQISAHYLAMTAS